MFFKFDRRLLGDLCLSAFWSLHRYFEIVTGRGLQPGIIAVRQTFGDRINLHIHLHFLSHPLLAALGLHRPQLGPGQDKTGIKARLRSGVTAYTRTPTGERSERRAWRRRDARCRLPHGAYLVDKTIDHLKLTFAAEKPPPPAGAFRDLDMVADPRSNISRDHFPAGE